MSTWKANDVTEAQLDTALKKLKDEDFLSYDNKYTILEFIARAQSLLDETTETEQFGTEGWKKVLFDPAEPEPTEPQLLNIHPFFDAE